MYIVFDIGGTKTRVASSPDGKEFDEVIIRSTPPVWEDAEAMLNEIFGSLAKKGDVKIVVGGIPGVLKDDHSTITWSPNLNGWLNKPVKETLEKATGSKVVLYNDTVVAGIGETNYGAGKGYEIVTYITVSTGVGGCRIVDGKVDEFRYGFEPGHQIIDANELLTLEDAVSGTAFAKKWGADFVHKAPESAWEDAARKLAVGIQNTIVHWSPDVVVLGGSMITKGTGIPVPVVFEYMKRLTGIYPKVPDIKVAELGDKNGLYGALVEAVRLTAGN